MPVEVDVWLRGSQDARTTVVSSLPADTRTWTEDDGRHLLGEMMRAVARERNPEEEPPPLTWRGFSWIVSPYEHGVLVHLEMPAGTASAGPFAVDAEWLTALLTRVTSAATAHDTVH